MTENPHANRPMAVWGSSLGEARVAVLIVHGRGQTPSFMQALSERFEVSGLRYYAPSAAADTWYPRPFLEPIEHNEPALSESMVALESHVSAVLSDGFTLDQVILCGFSQGACLLSHFVLSRPVKYGGLILLTGGYIGPDVIAGPVGKPLKGVPAVLRSIEDDPWVPRMRVEQTAAALLKAGAEVDLNIVPGDEHIITEEAVNAAATLLYNSASQANQNPTP
ncbi:alpha/beta hydrolase [Cryobacterium sp. N19]|uniref:alpha/beta hydrolase n=1 Tax=Cryobacterium sp. N19 TaxID=2048288 RepID=UPI000CE4F5C6|nr:phospholipase [Cryobacterium sp. N19]